MKKETGMQCPTYQSTGVVCAGCEQCATFLNVDALHLNLVEYAAATAVQLGIVAAPVAPKEAPPVDGALLSAVLTLDAAINKVLIAGGDYGDDLSDNHLRKTLEDAQHVAYRALISIGIEQLPGAANPLRVFLPKREVVPAAAPRRAAMGAGGLSDADLLKLESLVRQYGNVPLFGNEPTRKSVMTEIFDLVRPAASGALALSTIDVHLDAVLRASGSALRRYSMQKTLDDMRAAMRAAMIVPAEVMGPPAATGAGGRDD